jgi:hypothetical protein
MSFFDDVDEAPDTPGRRRAREASAAHRAQESDEHGFSPRGARSPGGSAAGRARRRGPPAGRRRPPNDRTTIQRRRLGLVVAAVVIVVLVVLGVHSCDVSGTDTALRDYANGVTEIIDASDQTGHRLFSQLGQVGGQTNAPSVDQRIVTLHAQADAQLARARALSVPSQVAAAQSKLLLALRMRADGLLVIANNLEQALSSTPTQAVDALATATARFYASDVLYKAYVAPEIAAALHGAGIAVGPPNGVTLAPGQFLASLNWLSPGYIAAELGVTLPRAKDAALAPGLHGHRLNFVKVGSTTLSPTATNTLAAQPRPTFTLNLTNDGNNVESDVVCAVRLSGGGPAGHTVIPETTPNETTNCAVKLPTAPKPGNYTLTAEVMPVPGETNVTNNKLTFPVTFR